MPPNTGSAGKSRLPAAAATGPMRMGSPPEPRPSRAERGCSTAPPEELRTLPGERVQQRDAVGNRAEQRRRNGSQHGAERCEQRTDEFANRRGQVVDNRDKRLDDVADQRRDGLNGLAQQCGGAGGNAGHGIDNGIQRLQDLFENGSRRHDDRIEERLDQFDHAAGKAATGEMT